MKIQNFQIYISVAADVVSAMDTSEAISTELKHLENEGVEAYDAHLKQQVIVVSPLLCVVADNPWASEILNHLVDLHECIVECVW